MNQLGDIIISAYMLNIVQYIEFLIELSLFCTATTIKAVHQSWRVY